MKKYKLKQKKRIKQYSVNKRIRKKTKKFKLRFFFLENNQKLITLKYKKTKIVKNIFNSLASINVGIKHIKNFVIALIFPYLKIVVNKLISNNYLFSLLVFKKPQETQLRRITKGWPIRKSLYNLIQWNWNRYLSYYDYAVLYYRKSTKYGGGFSSLTAFSSSSRHVYYTRKSVIKIIGKLSRLNYHALILLNTQFGLLSHIEIIKIKCGGNLLCRIE